LKTESIVDKKSKASKAYRRCRAGLIGGVADFDRAMNENVFGDSAVLPHEGNEIEFAGLR